MSLIRPSFSLPLHSLMCFLMLVFCLLWRSIIQCTASEISTVSYHKVPSDIFGIYTFSLIMIQNSPPVLFSAHNYTSNWCFCRLNIFLEECKLTRFICAGMEATVLKGTKYGKAVIHRSIKRQSIRRVLLMASRLQFKCGWPQLKGFNSVYSDNSYLP